MEELGNGQDCEGGNPPFWNLTIGWIAAGLDHGEETESAPQGWPEADAPVEGIDLDCALSIVSTMAEKRPLLGHPRNSDAS